MSLLNNLIDSFSIQNLQNFLRDKMPSFKPFKEDIEQLLNDKEFENYQSILKIGEAILNNEDILVFASNTTEHLTERTGKKNQYEIAKRILKEDRKDAALFIFYDDKGDFRFSFVRANYLGTKRDFTDFKRYSYFVSHSLTNNTFIKQVGGCSFNSLDEIIKAFSVEPLNKLFYQDIAKSFYSLIGGSVLENKKIVERATTLIMPTNKTDNRKTLQEFGVRFIGRTIFCWFLKNKVSSNNKPLIPADWLSSAKVTETPDYYHTYLEKLFFEILNEKHSDRITELPDGHQDIPFLNGGLFEPQADDYYVRGTLGISKYLNTLKVPNEWITSFFATLEQYNFTIDENSINDSEVSIDPEMLGTIFENLLAEIDPDTEKSARKSTGSFYTPREIVDYMVEQSLINYLKSKTNIDNDNQLQLLFKEANLEPETFSERQRISLLNALSDVKILDPACGSGAFPMGCLHKIILALQKLDTDASWWKAKQLSYQKNAMARKFLKEKLDNSNSDYIRKLGVIQNSIYGVDIQPIAAEISKLRSFLSLVIDENIDDNHPDGNRGILPLPNLEFKFVTANTLIGLEETRQQIQLFSVEDHKLTDLELLRESYLQTSGEEKKSIKQQFSNLQIEIFNEELKHFDKGLNKRALQLSEWQPFSNEGSSWFDPKWMFGVEKFDIVIGNPPYVDIKALPKLDVKEYFKIFKTTENRINLYSIFIEKGKSLLKLNGNLCFINPNSILINQSYKKIRKYIIDDVDKIVKLPDSVFTAASVETIILILNNNSEKKYIEGAFFLNNQKIDFNNLDYNLFERSEWKNDNDFRFNIFGNSEIQGLISKIELNTQKLDNFVFSSLGITPYDKVKGHSELLIKNREFHSNQKISKEYVPLISGKNIEKYFLKDEIKEFLKYGEWLGAPRDEKFFLNPKIIVRQILGGNEHKIIATYTSEPKYFTQIGFSLISKTQNTEELKFILSLINSKLLSFYHKNKFLDIEKILFQKILIINCKQLPIKNTVSNKKNEFIDKVDQILDNKQQNLDTTALENEIDVMVYKLYELTFEEVLFIDPGFGLSEQEYNALK